MSHIFYTIFPFAFASMDEIGLSDWSKVSANVHDGDNKTFVLSKTQVLVI